MVLAVDADDTSVRVSEVTMHSVKEQRTNQFSHQTSRGKVSLQKYDEDLPRQENGAAEYDQGWLSSYGFPECIKTCCWQNKPSQNWYE